MMVFFILYIYFIIFCFSNDTVVSSQIAGTKAFASFCVGGSHACVVFADKRLKCWGFKLAWGLSSDKRPDSLGDELLELGDSLPYIDVGDGFGIDQVSCGGMHTCIKTDTGDIKCLGTNDHGQLGIGDDISPVGEWNKYIGDALPSIKLGNGLQALDIVLGQEHSCVLLCGNKVKCFGFNIYGQLGQGNATDIGISASQMGNRLPFIDFGEDVEVSTVHSGATSYHVCVILSLPSQRVKCWGLNSNYQLGYGDQDNRGDDPEEMGDYLPLLNLGTESRVKQLSLSFYHACAILLIDSLKCWGNGANGQLGSGATNDITTTGNALPTVLIDSGKTIAMVNTGFLHTCVVFNNYVTVKCFGANTFGQLGQGDQIDRGNTPTTTIPSIPAIQFGTDLTQIKSIQSGLLFTCIVFGDSLIKCFGGNEHGQLGIESIESIGDENNEMDNNLRSVYLFSTPSPTKFPTSLTSSPTSLPDDGSTSPESRRCAIQSASTCINDTNCIWMKMNGKMQCVMFDCTILDQIKCKKQSLRCKWSNKKLTCRQRKQ